MPIKMRITKSTKLFPQTFSYTAKGQKKKSFQSIWQADSEEFTTKWGNLHCTIVLVSDGMKCLETESTIRYRLTICQMWRDLWWRKQSIWSIKYLEQTIEPVPWYMLVAEDRFAFCYDNFQDGAFRNKFFPRSSLWDALSFWFRVFRFCFYFSQSFISGT